MKIDGLFEVAIKVKNLDISARFYQEVIGFKKGLHDEERRWLFLWVGDNKGMVVLQEDKGSFPRQHFAFKVGESELTGLKEHLLRSDVVVEGPVSLDWMNADSVYFVDPDGHDVEFCATRNGSEVRSAAEPGAGAVMVTREFARQFAGEWIEAWNSHDLDRILSHYTDDFVMSSPRIAIIVGDESGVLEGKDAIRAYWKRAIELIPDLQFELISLFVGADSVALVYKNAQRLAVEVFFFNSEGKVFKAAANYA